MTTLPENVNGVLDEAASRLADQLQIEWSTAIATDQPIVGRQLFTLMPVPEGDTVRRMHEVWERMSNDQAAFSYVRNTYATQEWPAPRTRVFIDEVTVEGPRATVADPLAAWRVREAAESVRRRNQDVLDRLGLPPHQSVSEEVPVTQMDYAKVFGPELEDNSPELITWLESNIGCSWSRWKHRAVRHHALLEDMDDYYESQDADTGEVVVHWDNSRHHHDPIHLPNELRQEYSITDEMLENPKYPGAV